MSMVDKRVRARRRRRSAPRVSRCRLDDYTLPRLGCTAGRAAAAVAGVALAVAAAEGICWLIYAARFVWGVI